MDMSIPDRTTENRSDTDELSLLLPDREHRASKRFRWIGNEQLRLEASYEAGYRFRAYEIDGLGDIYDLADALRRAEDADVDRGVFAIRGQLREHVDASGPVNRQYKDNNDAPDWRPHPVGRRWLMLDLDDLEPPDWFKPPLFGPEFERAVSYARDHLPTCFQHATTFYQWSASAGLTCQGDDSDIYRSERDDLRLHLWFWCERRACSDSLRVWLKEWADETDIPLDWRVFNPVQPHFLACPTFVGGPDPLEGERSGLLEGDVDAVDLPERVDDYPSFQERKKREAQKRRKRRKRIQQAPRVRSEAQMASAESQYVESALQSACQTIASAPIGARETTLRDESFGIGTLVGAGALDPSSALRRLIQAGKRAGLPSDEATDKATRAFEAGQQNPRDLTEVRRKTPEHLDNDRSGETTDEGPSVNELREHFDGGDERNPYEPPRLESHNGREGDPLTDTLMRNFSFEGWMQAVDRIRREHPEHLPDSCRLATG